MSINISSSAGFVKATEPFCRLADSDTYRACDWDLTRDPAGRRYWVEFFKRHIETILKLGTAAAVVRGETLGSATARAQACQMAFNTTFNTFADRPETFTRVTILTLDSWRDTLLGQHGFADAFIDLKERENAKMLPLLPALCRQLDALTGEVQLHAIIEGVIAGNLFDMGAEVTAKAFLEGGPNFYATRGKLKRRPWLIDDLEALTYRFLNGRLHRKAVFFIDNAGSDFLLGALPMMRWLAGRGTTVVLAANERPSLNDMTIHDVDAWWPRIVAIEPSLASLPIVRVSTGTGEPLIDLAAVSPALNEAAADADLVILEGMGRGVESNLDAVFDCDSINLAMLKDAAVAGRCGGGLYDIVCRFRATGG